MNAPAPVVSNVVVLHPDGLAEVYGPPCVQARVVNMPAARNAREEIAAGAWLDRTLPRRLAELRVPSGPTLRASGVVENVRVAELARRAELARDVGGLVRQEWKDDETTKEEAPTVAAGPVCAEV